MKRSQTSMDSQRGLPRFTALGNDKGTAASIRVIRGVEKGKYLKYQEGNYISWNAAIESLKEY